MTQDDLARKVKTRHETIHHMEKGEHNPSLSVMTHIARVFSILVEKILLYNE